MRPTELVTLLCLPSPLMCRTQVCCRLRSLKTCVLEAGTCAMNSSGLTGQLACCISLQAWGSRVYPIQTTSLQHSSHFIRLQNVLICRSTSAITKLSGSSSILLSIILHTAMNPHPSYPTPSEVKKTPNVTHLITVSMPHGRGRQGGHPARTQSNRVFLKQGCQCIYVLEVRWMQ